MERWLSQGRIQLELTHLLTSQLLKNKTLFLSVNHNVPTTKLVSLTGNAVLQISDPHSDSAEVLLEDSPDTSRPLLLDMVNGAVGIQVLKQVWWGITAESQRS